MEQIQKNYLPAAGHDWMLPVYDPLVKLLGGHAARRALVLLRVVGFRGPDQSAIFMTIFRRRCGAVK
jgi:hypothetical protein